MIQCFGPGVTFLNSITFLDTAVSSFHITTGGNNTFITFNNRAAESSSMLPQFFDVRVRSTGDLAFSANAEGPIVLAGFIAKTENKILTVKGDVRCNNGTVSTTYRKWPKLAFATQKDRNWSRFSVMGSSMSITNQTAAFSVAKASLRVEKDATLVFNNGTPSSKYQWTAEPHRIMVYGTLRIEAPFVGGAHQMYGGDGTLEIKSSIQPSTAATRIGLTDGLLVKLSAAWPTVASTGADTPITIAAYSGRPVLHTARNWTYGPEAGTVTATTPAERAVFIRPEATLVVEPNGGIATFADPVTGPGTLEITNGTLVVQGGISADTHVAVAADAAFDLGASDASLAGIDVADGGALIFSGGMCTVSGDVSMSGAELQISAGMMGSGPGWKRLLVAQSISGTPTLPGPNWESRTIALEDGTIAFEVRIVRGTCMTLR